MASQASSGATPATVPTHGLGELHFAQLSQPFSLPPSSPTPFLARNSAQQVTSHSAPMFTFPPPPQSPLPQSNMHSSAPRTFGSNDFAFPVIASNHPFHAQPSTAAQPPSGNPFNILTPPLSPPATQRQVAPTYSAPAFVPGPTIPPTAQVSIL